MAHPVSSALAKIKINKGEWITPEEQLKKFDQLTTPKKFLIEKIMLLPHFIRVLATLVADYCHDERLTHWYASLKLTDKLPPHVPPLLPDYVFRILNSPCPKQICNEKKPDGSFYTIGEKCTLTLVPEELKKINDLKKTKHPFRFELFFEQGCEKEGDTPFETTHWEIQTNSVLEGSRNKTLAEQTHLVRSLAKETGQNWQIPTLRGTVAAIFLKAIGTGKSLYQADKGEHLFSYTRIQGTPEGTQLIVGFFQLFGVQITKFDSESCSIGMGAVLKIS